MHLQRLAVKTRLTLEMHLMRRVSNQEKRRGEESSNHEREPESLNGFDLLLLGKVLAQAQGELSCVERLRFVGVRESLQSRSIRY